GASIYLLDVPGDDPDTPAIEGGREGESITFQVAGFDATPLSLWFGGSHHELNLQVTTGSDLMVSQVGLANMTTDPQTLAVGGTIMATIANQGNIGVPAATAFAVTFFEDRNGNARYDPAADNTLGQATHTTGLGAGAEVEVAAAVVGQVLFRDNLVYALVDSGDAVTELDESNNLNHSGSRCEVRPPVGQFNPVLEWYREVGQSGVMMAPMVVDLTADGIPDVVYINTELIGNGVSYFGYVGALNGNDGSLIFSVPDPRVVSQISPAVGDIDLDGQPEIVVSTGGTYVALEHDGTIKWQSSWTPQPFGGPSIADLDRDGIPEIVVGAAVLNNDGTFRWGNRYSAGGMPLVANLDLKGDPEVVVNKISLFGHSGLGNTAYRSDGSIYWDRPDLKGRFNAVANFDDDPFPEIVGVGDVKGSKVYLLEHDGTLKWGPVDIPDGDPGDSRYPSGGPPTIGDVDGDGEPEIGVASVDRYTVFETDGTVKWSNETQDFSSAGTSSSMFDFEGDGSAEIIYSDEVKLRIYRGTDGTVLFETPVGNNTIVEYPVIVDVDADGNAEIVVASTSKGNDPGIYVFGDANDTWVPTRQIWNQYQYHINNVNDDGTIPIEETNSWQDHNTYRLNTLPDPFRAPDPTASWLR
ncbi:MAG: FG-GAP-like repeat-containing protein, partial [Anaerolineae bacterium]